MPTIPSFLIGFGIFWLFVEARLRPAFTSSALWTWLIRFVIWIIVTVSCLYLWKEAEAYSDQAFLSAGALGMLARYAVHITKKTRNKHRA